MTQDVNPYSSPIVTEVRSTEAPTDLEKVRLEHLSHEAALKAVGSLFIIASMSVSSLMTIFTLKFLKEELVSNEKTFVLTYWVLVPILTYLGIKMRRLDYSVRKVVIVAGGLMMFAFPIGTVAGPFVLYAVCCQKGKYILSHGYTNVLYLTPRIRYKTKLSTKIFTGLISISVMLFILYYVSPQFREILKKSMSFS
ncbi:MAG: hypothetical protein CMJ76_11030 [Planctomycetaceae bacterium]|nr:hypothetical protein [Planctomycetaceae bacterium]